MAEVGALAGRVVVITGAGRGIGAAVASLVAASGGRVVVNDLGSDTLGQGSDEEPARTVVEEIVARGGEAVAHFGDISNNTTAHELIGTALETFGRLDGVVNSAGMLRDAIFHKLSESDWDAVLRVHLKGSFNVSSAAAGVFRQAERGAMVHMTSTSGHIGNRGQANYMAAKMGIAGLSRAIALDMARFGVRSNAVAPFAWSRLTASVPTDNEVDRRRVEQFRKLEPDTVAPLVVHLLSDAAADITGQIFTIRRNEIFLMSQPRPVRSIHTSDGWTVESLADRLGPAFRSSLVPLETSGEVFSWDPI